MKKRRNNSPETVAKRKRIWRHNGFLGTVVMAQKGMLAIMEADSTTDNAKGSAARVYNQLTTLAKDLKERVDAN